MGVDCRRPDAWFNPRQPRVAMAESSGFISRRRNLRSRLSGTAGSVGLPWHGPIEAAAPVPSSTVSDRHATRYILIAIALFAVAALLWVIRDALVIGFGAIVFATLLRASAIPLSHRTGLTPRWSVVIMVLTLLTGAGLLAWFFGAQAAHQFDQFREQIPAAMEKVRTWLAGIPGGKTLAESLQGGGKEGEALS
ncbi:MAG: hypothetical protein RIQ93_2593, partial [Verrucomicrobiota bacterium]